MGLEQFRTLIYYFLKINRINFVQVGQVSLVRWTNLVFLLCITYRNKKLCTFINSRQKHTPFSVENHQHWTQQADEENNDDGNKDHSVEDIFISCWVKKHFCHFNCYIKHRFCAVGGVEWQGAMRSHVSYVQPHRDPECASRSRCRPVKWLSLSRSSFLGWGWTAERHAGSDTSEQRHIRASPSGRHTQKKQKQRESQRELCLIFTVQLTVKTGFTELDSPSFINRNNKVYPTISETRLLFTGLSFSA